MIGRLVGAATLALAAACGAQAQDCSGGAFVAAYRQGEAALGRKDTAAATAALTPLAEQGLGAAQLKLASITDDPAKAALWTALAAAVDTPGAKAQLASLEAKLTPDQVSAQRAAARAWKPTLGPCLAGTPAKGNVPAGGPAIVDHVFAFQSAKLPPEQRGVWLKRTVDGLRASEPRALIALRMLGGVAFRSGPVPFVVVDVRDNQPVVIVNEEQVAANDTSRGREVAGAAAYAVNKSLIPVTVAYESAGYKGRSIKIPATEEGRRFLAEAKRAIDMADGLPGDLAALARAVTDLRYEPTEPYDRRGGAIAPGDTAYDADGHRYTAFKENVEQRGPAALVLNMVSTGVRLRHSAELEPLERQLADARKRNAAAEVTKLQQRIGETRQRIDNDKKLLCDFADNGIKTMEALKLDKIEIDRAYRGRTQRGCA